jgi:hypothetical protein
MTFLVSSPANDRDDPRNDDGMDPDWSLWPGAERCSEAYRGMDFKPWMRADLLVQGRCVACGCLPKEHES